jgi:hypothetical protein
VFAAADLIRAKNSSEHSKCLGSGVTNPAVVKGVAPSVPFLQGVGDTAGQLKAVMNVAGTEFSMSIFSGAAQVVIPSAQFSANT